ncbi:MAG: hypothetical protein R2716_11515 [Microthrixaceae bacterium]
MERRYDLLSEVGVRDITGYNAAYDRGDLSQGVGADREFDRLPFILVVVDELSDLMMVAPATWRTRSAGSRRWPARSASTSSSRRSGHRST